MEIDPEEAAFSHCLEKYLSMMSRRDSRFSPLNQYFIFFQTISVKMPCRQDQLQRKLWAIPDITACNAGKYPLATK